MTHTLAPLVDQVFVLAKHAVLMRVPAALQPLASAVLSVLPLLIVFPLLFAVTTVLERKGLGRMQNRLGPNRTGPAGFFQPAADGIKSLTKEDVIPRGADGVVHYLAPLLLVVTALSAYAVLPIGRNMVVADLDAGVLFFFAAGSVAELAVFMAGWSSRNKYSLLGAMRGIAQMISYEIPLVLSALAVVLCAGSLSTVAIVERQASFAGIFPRWNVFTPWGLMGFTLFLIAAAAESNRAPFDLPEGESEIVAGYFIEYSGFKFALFFLGEYLGLFAISAMAITLFLGGWSAPLSFLAFVPSWLWFFLKLIALIAFFIWVRGTVPRLRMDQLMSFAWKFLLPMAVLNLFVAAVWMRLGPGALRWLVTIAMLALPLSLVNLRLRKRRRFLVRTYRFSD